MSMCDMDEYEDVLTTLLIACELERLAKYKKKNYNQVIIKTTNLILKRVKFNNIAGVLVGIKTHSNPLWALNKVVTEYSKIIEQIQKNGFAVLGGVDN